MSLASAIAMLLRRHRSDVAALGLVSLLIAFTAFVATAGLRLFERTADDALRREVAAAPVTQRTVELAATRTLVGQDSARTMTDWQAEEEQLRSALPEGLWAIVGEGSLAIDSMRLRVSNPPDYPMFMSVHYVDDLPELAALEDGRWPISTNQQLPPVAEFPATGAGTSGRPRATNHASDQPRRFEVALQEGTARSLGIGVGYVLHVQVDRSDTVLVSSVLGPIDVSIAPTELEVTGLYRLHEPESDEWFGDQRLTFDDLGTARDEPVADINAYMASDALPGFIASGLPFEYRWRFPILVDRLEANGIAQTEEALRVFSARPPGTGASSDVAAAAGLLPLLERHGALRAASEALLAVAANAPLALAGGAIAVAAMLLAARRRSAMILARGRGASPRLLLAATLVEAMLVATFGSMAGLGVAMALEPAAEIAPSVVAASLIALVGVVVLVGAGWSPIRRPLADLESAERVTRRTDPRRLVLEIGLVVLALAGAYVLRQRGIGPRTFDPFLAAVPALIAVATGIVAIRLYRPLMALVGWLADRRRGLVAAMGFRALARGAASGLPVLVLLLAVAFAAFMSVVLSSVDRAQRAASWAAVGADARLDRASVSRSLPTHEQVAAVPGVTAATAGYVDRRVRPPSGTRVASMTFHALDPAAYATVVEGSPIEPRWSGQFVEPDGRGALPVIIGNGLTGGNLGLRAGETFHHTLFGRQLQLVVAEVRSSVPGLTENNAFMIVPHSRLELLLEREIEPTVVWVRATEEAILALREATGAEGGAVRVETRYEEYAALRDAPLVRAVSAGFGLTLGVSVAYAVLTMLGAMVLSASRRTRDVAILRTLGLNAGQATRLTLLEHGPPILVALPVGLALGLGVTLTVTPALNLGAFSGASGAIPLAVDWLALAALSAVVAAVALVSVVTGTWLSRRARIVNALRITSD